MNTEKCEAILREREEIFVCELEAGHGRKHRHGGVTWTNGGSARLMREAQEAKQKYVQQ
jgi:hypothetical protein